PWKRILPVAEPLWTSSQQLPRFAVTIRRTVLRLTVGVRAVGGWAGVLLSPTGSFFWGSPRVHATITSAVTAAIPSSVSRTTRDWTWTPRDGGADRLGRAGASSSPTTKRELYSSTYNWPSRPRYSAYERRKPLTYVCAGSTSNCSSSSARRYLARILVDCSISGKSRAWRRRASRRLFPISNTAAAHCTAIPSKCTRRCQRRATCGEASQNAPQRECWYTSTNS